MQKAKGETSDSTPTENPCAGMKAAAGVVSAGLQWIDKGFTLQKVDETTAGMRIAICQGCPTFIQSERRCGECCCPMDFKTTLKYDPFQGITRKTLIQCPFGKW
jgi:hypothetical protein